ncbi:MAG: hypothetical protein AAF127_13545 [Pseudomonadota bacterium]
MIAGGLIDHGREPLKDPTSITHGSGRRGGALAMFALLLAVWVTGRVVLWESPYAPSGLVAEAKELFAQNEAGALASPDSPQFADSLIEPSQDALPAVASFGAGMKAGRLPAVFMPGQTPFAFSEGVPERRGVSERVRLAGAHHYLWSAAMQTQTGLRPASFIPEPDRDLQPFSPSRPSTPAQKKARADRWSLDAWVFARQGSGAAPISQLRVPVYGASQAGATLQYRAAPKSGFDPRLYVRAYRALIERNETEIAAGVSARPIPTVPVRVAAEMRVTDGPFFSETRPAAFAVTELPPAKLPLKLVGEAYVGAGYVGGVTDTAFVDGQASLTRQVIKIGPERLETARLSLGAGAWGGAQRDAQRLDVGPTMRLDLALGDIPARFSIDWRERVAGDAAPVSGVAATLSTQF